MIEKITLHSTQEEFESLHYELDKVRSTSKTVRVSKSALHNILMDHSLLINKLKDKGIDYANSERET